MLRTTPRPLPSRLIAGGLLLLTALACLGLAAVPVRAQLAEGTPNDVRFELVDATTMRGAQVERLTLEYLTQRANAVLEVDRPDTSFTAEDVPLLERGDYLVTVWKDGVPYFFSRRGRELMGEPQTLHVFSTTTDRADVHVTGLTMVLKREESLLAVEIMLQVQNDAQPQATVVGTPGPLTLHLPEDLTDVEAEYHRGPDPTPVAVEAAGGDFTLGAPLVTGPNRLRLTGTLPWREGREVQIGANVPVDDWGTMVSPEWMRVESFEIEGETDAGADGYRRFKGAPIGAGRTLTLRVHSGEGEPAPAGDVFTEPAPEPEADAAADAPREGRGLRTILILAGIVVVILLLLTTRKQG